MPKNEILNSAMSDWVTQRIAEIINLRHIDILEWCGLEMAIGEAADGIEHTWMHSSISMLQFTFLEVVTANGTYCFHTYQDDTDWGIYLSSDHLPSKELGSGCHSIFRYRKVIELPIGRIENSTIRLDDRANIATVVLTVNGHDVAIMAGEIYENNDSIFSIIYNDESLLVQVDGRMPTVV